MGNKEIDVAQITGSQDPRAHTVDAREGKVSADYHNAAYEAEHPNASIPQSGTLSQEPDAHSQG